MWPRVVGMGLGQSEPEHFWIPIRAGNGSPLHSTFNATTGSTRSARMAGTRHAAALAMSSTTAAPAYVIGSRADTP